MTAVKRHLQPSLSTPQPYPGSTEEWPLCWLLCDSQYPFSRKSLVKKFSTAGENLTLTIPVWIRCMNRGHCGRFLLRKYTLSSNPNVSVICKLFCVSKYRRRTVSCSEWNQATEWRRLSSWLYLSAKLSCDFVRHVVTQCQSKTSRRPPCNYKWALLIKISEPWSLLRPTMAF